MVDKVHRKMGWINGDDCERRPDKSLEADCADRSIGAVFPAMPVGRNAGARFRQNPQKWRKCMGIEPTGHTVIVQPNDFEDRGHHQVCKHFQSLE